MGFKEVSSFNDFTNRVYSEAPESLKEAYRSGLKLKEVSSLKLPGVPSTEGLGSYLQETVTSSVENLTDFGSKAGEAVKDLGGWLGDISESAVEMFEEGVDSAEEWVDQKVEEYKPVIAEKFKDLSEYSSEAAVRTMAKASPLLKVLPVNISKFAAFLGEDGKIEISEYDLDSKNLDFLREKAVEVIESGGDKFTYETWGSTEGSILGSDAIRKSLMGDQNAIMATLIGQTAPGNVRIENGRIIVEDVYDFNSGPRGEKMREAIKLREQGKEEEAQKLSEEALEGLTFFGQVRVWAGALGAPQGEGTRYKLDLGSYKQYKRSQNKEYAGAPDLKDDQKARRGFWRTSPMSGLVTPGD